MKKVLSKVWEWIKAPFIWMWVNLRDWRTAVIFFVVFLLLSSEVWVPYLIGFIIPATRAYLWSIGSACWIFWLGPGTPFLPLCMAITVGVKALFNKIRKTGSQRHEKLEGSKIPIEDDKVSQNVQKQSNNANEEIKHESEEIIVAAGHGSELD